MAQSKVRIAIVGGGRTGTPLLVDLLDRPYIEVVGLADADPDSPGAKLARENGIFVTEHADVLAAKGSGIDVLIELSGDPTVKPALKEAFMAQGNRHTTIVNDLVARLIMTLAHGADELMESYHPDDQGIG